MNKRLILILCLILFIISVFVGYKLFNNKTEEEESETETYISEKIEDECTEEYKQLQNATTVS